ncbi:LPP20 family lipoprotein [Marinomonas colpomeniae]|uniref:LPP20 family lipoprotein n=1 Tax=Marinomonas colpomeniae TaxID=2774408 RepID=A0ABR8P2L4_9GAMM|nr:LPP20 family lipoprotein [Marinomonas colpomeniae]MBD5771007.1 LPP20 family lipoprotein [Marinomonas colpomeniae]
MIPPLIPKPLNWLLTLGLLASLTGCLGSDTKKESAESLPNWVTSPPKDSTYLYGVGSSARIENIALAFTQAEQNGNAQIAQQLRTQVSQVNTQDTTVASSGQGSEQVSKVHTAYTQVTTAPIELEQAVNEKRFAHTNYVYALQSIDRSRIVAKLRLALTELDSKIRDQAKRLSTDSNQPPAQQDWQTYMGLIPHFAQRKSYQDELSLYSTERTLASTADQDIQDIEQQLGQALFTYGFDTSTTKQSNELSSALSQYGLTPKSNSLFTLKSTTTQHNETQSGRFYVFEDGTLELIGPTGDRLASWEVSARGIARTKQAAEGNATQNWSLQAIEAMFVWLTRLK